MDENEIASLDMEFKRYLQLLRPYLVHLMDENIITLCDSWIQRLSNCTESEKALRNKYVFLLCYQLSRGVLDRPFLNKPPAKLLPLCDDSNSDDSQNEFEGYMSPDRTRILFDSNRKVQLSESISLGGFANSEVSDKKVSSLSLHNNKLFCYEYPALVKNDTNKMRGEDYELRANNLVRKLRQIKMENILLNNELNSLKQESKLTHDNSTQNHIVRVDNATSTFVSVNDSSTTLKSLKCQLQEIQESRNMLIETVSHLQDQLDHFNELKKNHIDEIEAKCKLELIKVRTDAREETKIYYENKLEELKQNHELTVSKIQEAASNDIQAIIKSKDDIISEKDILLESKDKNINGLMNQIEAQKITIQSMLNQFMEKSNEETACQGLKIQNQLLEKRLNKIEKAKYKNTKIYEAKIAQLQRDKHLSDCSLQLQLVKQRAQVVSELTEENQNELNTSLDKLESKYKDIVANVQATAIQRRIQDQRALESILHAACGICDSSALRNLNESYESENLHFPRNIRVSNVVLGNKSYGEDSVLPGYCLNGERMGELFERVYIPQRGNYNVEKK